MNYSRFVAIAIGIGAVAATERCDIVDLICGGNGPPAFTLSTNTEGQVHYDGWIRITSPDTDCGEKEFTLIREDSIRSEFSSNNRSRTTIQLHRKSGNGIVIARIWDYSLEKALVIDTMHADMDTLTIDWH